MKKGSKLKDYLSSLSNNYTKKLKIVHLNAQSLNDSSHFSEFCHIFVNSEIDIVAVSETFFKDSSNMEIPGYNVFSVNRNEKRGGGVALYVREGINSKILCKSTGESSQPEFILMDITLNSEKILVMSIYRPPKVGYMDNVEKELFKYMSEYKYTVICGDLNARFGSGSAETKILENMLQVCNLEPLPLKATYHTKDCDSILDVIATNCNNIVLSYGQQPAPGFSNHDLIYCVMDLQKPKHQQQYVTYRDMKIFALDEFVEEVGRVDWNTLYNVHEIDEKLGIFNNTFMQIIDKHAPLKRVKVKKNGGPWMDSEIYELMDRRDAARKKWLRTKNCDDKESFRIIRNKTKQSIRNAKLKHFHNIFDKNKSNKEMWKAI